ncbi:hypothetical protein R1sor_023431 [Riccia sorocarpa]|uniref:Uncharacterized protein n=1 Tax=Riccia sorocarpa TaxID=122646 RepID=A0ABD3GMM0_9MARC
MHVISGVTSKQPLVNPDRLRRKRIDLFTSFLGEYQANIVVLPSRNPFDVILAYAVVIWRFLFHRFDYDVDVSSYFADLDLRAAGMASASGNKGLSGRKQTTPEDLLEHATHLELENRFLEARVKTLEVDGRKNRIDDLRRELRECKETL